MTSAFSMEYPHWPVLLVIGFLGMALRQRVAQAEFKEMATGAEEERSEPEAEPDRGRQSERMACRAEHREMG